MYINSSVDKFINEYIDYYAKSNVFKHYRSLFSLYLLVLQVYVREVYIIQNINIDYVI